MAVEPTACAACGAVFGCGAASSGCWCADLQLSEVARSDLSAQFRSCLCRDCLEGFASSDEVPKAVEHELIR